jgi:hypothetical protein
VRARSAEEEAQLDFSRTPAEEAAACDDLLNGNSDGSEILLPVRCPFDIGNGAGSAVLSIDATDTIRILQNDRLLFFSPNDLDQSASTSNYINNIESGSGPFVEPGMALQLQDVTYDGYKDLAVLDSAGAYNFTYDYYAYDPKTGSYMGDPIVSATNPTVDTTARTITSQFLGRGIGDIYDDETYQFENGQYVLVREESQDFADQTSYDGNAGYRRKVWALQNGKMVLTQNAFLSQQQAMGGNAQ